MPNVLTAMFELNKDGLLSDSDLREQLDRFFFMYQKLLSHSEHAGKYHRVKMIKYDGKSFFICIINAIFLTTFNIIS